MRGKWRGWQRPSIITLIRRRLIIVIGVGGIFLLIGCRSGKIPDRDSYAAQLYLKRCGQCHQPYSPNLMTATMWASQVDLMRQRMKEAGVPPLTSAERKTILDYLTSNAGKQ